MSYSCISTSWEATEEEGATARRLAPIQNCIEISTFLLLLQQLMRNCTYKEHSEYMYGILIDSNDILFS